MVLCTSELGDHQFPHPRYATDDWGRVKIGVKMPPPIEGEDRRPLPADALFSGYADDVGQARMDAMALQRSCNVGLERYDRLAEESPEQARVEAERDYGTGTTVEEAKAKLFAQREEARVWMEELRDDPHHHYFDLVELLDAELTVPVAERFRSLYSSQSSAHVQWLVIRSCVKAEREALGPSNFPFSRPEIDGVWGEDGIWRRGELPAVRPVDPADPALRVSLIDHPVGNAIEVRERSLKALERAAALVRFHEAHGDEERRAHWRDWMNMEISAHAHNHVTAVDFSFPIEHDAPHPSPQQVRQWEDEINLLDSEDNAKLRYWEAVKWANAKDASMAEWYEKEAEETRVWAADKRTQFERRHRRVKRLGVFSPLARRMRAGHHRRQSRGGSFSCKGSRRVTSRSAGGGGSGDDPPGDPEPGRARRPGLQGETHNERPDEGALHIANAAGSV